MSSSRPWCGLMALLALAVLPGAGRVEPLPGNVSEANLGDEGAAMAIRLLEVPNFIGERLVFEVTVRNTATIPRVLPLPSATNVSVGLTLGGPYGGINSVRHRCPDMGYLDEVPYGRAECIQHLAKNSVKLAPGESRSTVWVSDAIGRKRSRLSTEGANPATFGVRVSSHDVLPDRWFRFTVRRIEPGQGQVLQSPTTKAQRYFLVARADPDRYLVLSTGIWYPVVDRVPESFDAAEFEELVSAYGLHRYAVVSRPNVSLAYDSRGDLLVDGIRSAPVGYEFGPDRFDGWVKSGSSTQPTATGRR